MMLMSIMLIFICTLLAKFMNIRFDSKDPFN